MNTFNKKSLYVALGSLSALGVTGAAEAVNISQDGLGQALVYPYYTTQSPGGNAYNSLLSVVNSTATAKVVKVRFLEGKFSREVLDFNLWLSKFDVWTAAVIPSGTGAGIFSTDLSCTTPRVSNSAASPTNFVNYAYQGDPLPQTLDRTKEGYVEIIEMGDLTGATATAITHVQPSPPGVPPGCATLPNTPTPPTDLIVGGGGLFGGMTLINVLGGTDFTSDPTVLANYSAITLWADGSQTNPDLTRVNPKTSVVFTGSSVVTTDWSTSSNSVDAVSAVLMRNSVYNEFVLDAATKSGTDWVVTFPTKKFYYSGNSVTKLFQRNLTSSGACDDVANTVYNREEQTVTSPQGFSPPAPTGTDSICYEANVITFNGASVLGSANLANFPTTFQNGWLAMNFPVIGSPSPAAANHTLPAPVGATTIATLSPTGAVTVNAGRTVTYQGLPVIGFAVQSFTNGLLPSGTTTVLSNYGGDFGHRYTRSIQ